MKRLFKEIIDNFFYYFFPIFIIALVVAVIFALVLILVDLKPAWASDIVVETIAYESSGESLEAQVMVAQCILTRAKEWNKTPEEICLQKYQFSCWNKGIHEKMTKRTQRELAKASQSLKIALERHDLPEVTHYYDISVEPYWSQSMAFICQIGKLKFYYENRN